MREHYFFSFLSLLYSSLSYDSSELVFSRMVGFDAQLLKQSNWIACWQFVILFSSGVDHVARVSGSNSNSHISECLPSSLLMNVLCAHSSVSIFFLSSKWLSSFSITSLCSVCLISSFLCGAVTLQMASHRNAVSLLYSRIALIRAYLVAVKSGEHRSTTSTCWLLW